MLADIQAAKRQQETLRHRDHRPWPLPSGPWVLAQSWEELLFAHWRVPADEMRQLLPDVLSLDLYEGSAWLGITPFRVMGLRPRYTLPLLVISRFCELNVQTYVTFGGKPGIFFFSLDAASRAAVAGARLAYRLPYFYAHMRARWQEGWIDYRSRRLSPDPTVEFGGRYRPRGSCFFTPPGTLEHFLTERYSLYTVKRNRVFRAEIHHPPWPLQEAEAQFEQITVSPLALGGAPLLHFAARQDVLTWPLASVED